MVLGHDLSKEFSNSAPVSSFRVVPCCLLPSSSQGLGTVFGLILGLTEDDRLGFGASVFPRLIVRLWDRWYFVA